MKWLRQHKWTLIISVLLFLGITTCQNLDQSKHSLSYSSYQIPSDKIDTSRSDPAHGGSVKFRRACHRDCYQFNFFSL